MRTIEADPAILREVGSVSRPERGLPTCPDLSRIHGDDSIREGLHNLLGWFTRGQDYARASAERRGPIARSRLGIERVVMVTDPALCARALRNTEGVWSTALGWFIFVEGLMPGTVLLTSDFEDHRRLRRLLQPAFSRSAIEGYAESATDYFESATDDWLAVGSVPFKSAIRRLAARVSAKVFIGTDDATEARRLDEDMAAFWAATMSFSKSPWLSPIWRKGRSRIRSLAQRLVDQVEARRVGEGRDLFSRLCQSSDESEWLDDVGRVYLFINIMQAAFDTTAAALTSMAYALAVRRDWQERLRAEALAVSQAPLAYTDAASLEQLDWFWKETLRFYPVAFAVPRRPLRDVELDGVTIPAGTFVQFQIGMPLRDPTRWSNPDSFDPERFSPARAEDKAQRDAFLPFGAGAHACIGQQLSTLEAKLFWHSLLRKARFRLARPYQARHQLTPLGAVSGKVRLALEPIE